MKCICTLNCRGIYSAIPPLKLQIPAASQLAWYYQDLLCALPASGPPRTLFFMVKKGIFFVLNPSSLLWTKQNRDSWGKDLGKVLRGRAWPWSQLSQDPTCYGEMGLKPSVQTDSNICPAQWRKSTELLKAALPAPRAGALDPRLYGCQG